jgi:PIN domain nuclease of toxin-antitoxin system
MRYLIDTHVCLWAVAEKHKLSAHVKEILENPENEILYS